MLHVVSTLTETTAGVGLLCVTCAIRHAGVRKQRQETIARRVLGSNILISETEASVISYQLLSEEQSLATQSAHFCLRSRYHSLCLTRSNVDRSIDNCQSRPIECFQ